MLSMLRKGMLALSYIKEPRYNNSKVNARWSSLFTAAQLTCIGMFPQLVGTILSYIWTTHPCSIDSDITTYTYTYRYKLYSKYTAA